LIKDIENLPDFKLTIKKGDKILNLIYFCLSLLKNAELLIIEAYNFQLTNDSLKFYELCVYMEQKGFRCVDLAEPVHRQKDKSFWQVDLFFIPSNNVVFSSNSYQ